MIDDPKSSNSGNVFTGNVGSISGSSSSFSITPEDPNRFIWSQFFIGLLLIPIFAGFIIALSTILSEDAQNDTYYDDSHYFSDNYDEDYFSMRKPGIGMFQKASKEFNEFTVTEGDLMSSKESVEKKENKGKGFGSFKFSVAQRAWRRSRPRV